MIADKPRSTLPAVPEWLTITEAAAYLKVNRKTIYNYMTAGRLPYFELETGGGRRIRREDLDALLRGPLPRPPQ